MHFTLPHALLVALSATGLFAADDLRPPTARWLDGDRILVVSNALPTAPWLVQLQAACAAGQPLVRCRAECTDAVVAKLFRKVDRLHVTADLVVIAVGEADARRAAKSRKSDYLDEFQRRVAAQATGASAMGAVVLLMSTSADPKVLSAIRAAATGTGVASTTMDHLVADLGRAAAHLPPRITIAGDRVFTDATTLTVTVGRIDPLTTKLRWWREPGDQSKAITQAISKPLKLTEPGLIQVRVEDAASGTIGSASVFVRQMDFVRPDDVRRLVPGLRWCSGAVPLTPSGDLELPTLVTGGRSGDAAVAAWPADAGESLDPASAQVVVFDGYLVIRQQGMHRFIATGDGVLRLDVSDHRVIEHPSRDTIDSSTIGCVPLMVGVHRVRLVLARLPGSEPATLTCRTPKATIYRPLKLDELGAMVPIKAK